MDNNLNNNADMNSNKNNTSKIIGAVVSAVVLVSGVGFLVNSQMNTQKANEDKAAMKKSEESAMMKKSESEAMMKKTESEAMMKKDAMAKEGSAMAGSAMAMTKAGVFTTYSEAALTKTEGHKNILFFSATWCPTCQATNKDIQANLDKIDPKLHILSVDYDTNQALRTKYGVTMQHTFVEVDGSGNLIKKTNGLGTVSAINMYAFPAASL
jgi:hypothetical protein